MARAQTETLAACARIAARRHGVITRAQALKTGLSSSAIGRLLGSGAWHSPHRGVYSLWTPEDEYSLWLHDLYAGTSWLGDGSSVSHRAAARVLGLDGVDGFPREFVTERSHRARTQGLVVYRVRALPRQDLTICSGLVVTSPCRTMLDLATLGDEEATELAFESILRRKLATRAEIADAIAASYPTRRGRGTLRGLVRLGDLAVTESVLETRLWRLIRGSGLPVPVRQFEVLDSLGRFVARVDFAYPEAQLAIEAEGYRFHASRREWERDRRRMNALAHQGWTVYRATWDDVMKRPRAVVADIERLRSTSAGRSVAPGAR